MKYPLNYSTGHQVHLEFLFPNHALCCLFSSLVFTSSILYSRNVSRVGKYYRPHILFYVFVKKKIKCESSSYPSFYILTCQRSKLKFSKRTKQKKSDYIPSLLRVLCGELLAVESMKNNIVQSFYLVHLNHKTNLFLFKRQGLTTCYHVFIH